MRKRVAGCLGRLVLMVMMLAALPRLAALASKNRRANASVSVVRTKHASFWNALIPQSQPPKTCRAVHNTHKRKSRRETVSQKLANATYSTSVAGDAIDTWSAAPLKSLVSESFLSQFQWAPNIPPDRYTDLPKNQRVVVMGDVHGDAYALKQFLRLAGVVHTSRNSRRDEDDDDISNLHWTGGDTILISLGDILDRGVDELACLQALASLSRQAQKAGGAVHLLYGNHESLNAAGLFHYALEGGNDEYERVVGAELDEKLKSKQWRVQFAGNQAARWATMEPGGILSESTMQYCQVAVQVGRTVCVHAGLTKEHLDEFGGIEGMNRQTREWILTSHHGDNNNVGKYESLEALLASAERRAQAAAEKMPECLGGGIGSESPVWMRDYSQPNDAPPRKRNAQAMIDKVLSALDADRMVMGHTPQFHINAALKGKAWRVDVGASKGVMGAPPQVLEIIHGGDEPDKVSVITQDGIVAGADCFIVESIE